MKCPFCTEDDFDAVGLKIHLIHWCNPYDSIVIPESPFGAQRNQKEGEPCAPIPSTNAVTADSKKESTHSTVGASTARDEVPPSSAGDLLAQADKFFNSIRTQLWSEASEKWLASFDQWRIDYAAWLKTQPRKEGDTSRAPQTTPAPAQKQLTNTDLNSSLPVQTAPSTGASKPAAEESNPQGRPELCPRCKQPWEAHEFGVPEPYCPDYPLSNTQLARNEMVDERADQLESTPEHFDPLEWLTLLLRCQDGRATCMFVLEAIERETVSIAWVKKQRAKLLHLCYAIESLPASEQQTKLSIQASEIQQEFQAILRTLNLWEET